MQTVPPGVLLVSFEIEEQHIRLVPSSAWHRAGSWIFRTAGLEKHLQHDGSSHQQQEQCSGVSSVVRVPRHCEREAVLLFGFLEIFVSDPKPDHLQEQKVISYQTG